MPVQPSVVWITSGFPYGGGEQFIETEVPHWAEFKGHFSAREPHGPRQAAHATRGGG